MKEARELIDAWESLEGNRNHSNKDIAQWLIKKMKPAMDKLRRKLNYGIIE